MRKTTIFITLNLLFILYYSGFSQDQIIYNDYYIYSHGIQEYVSDMVAEDEVKTLIISRSKTNYNIGCQYLLENLDSICNLEIFENLVIKDDTCVYVDTILIELSCKLDSMKHEKSKPILNDFNPDFNTKVISDFELKRIFRWPHKNGWERFYRKYPDSFGVIELSDIVFSDDGKYCMFYLGYQRASLWGYGCLIVLDLTQKEPFIKKKVGLWVS